MTYSLIRRSLLSLSLLFSVLAILSPALHAEYNPIERVSVDNNNNELDLGGSSGNIQVSADGRYVVFVSSQDGTVAGDSNGLADVFLHDRQTNTISIISVDSDERAADGSSSNPVISSDGLFVAFESNATNLVANDDNEATDIFLRDIANGLTTRVSVDSAENEATGSSTSPSISSTGRYVAFESSADDLVAGDTNELTDVFLRDTTGGTTVRVSVTTTGNQAENGASSSPSLSGDGSLIAFQSLADNIAAADNNEASDIFVRDTSGLGSTTLVSRDETDDVGDGSSSDPRISLDGTLIVFTSSAQLVGSDNDSVNDIFAFTVATNTVTEISIDSNENESDGNSSGAYPSSDGRFVLFTSYGTNLHNGDDNEQSDVFVRDRTNGTTHQVSLKRNSNTPAGGSTGSGITADGEFVVFQSTYDDFVAADNNGTTDVFVFNTQCQLDTGVTPIDSDSDGTDDCDDDCGDDPNKTSGGQCGCNEADTDTDSDGTADCNDSCPDDSAKTGPGDCGCGESDDDDSGNGVADCLDPTTETVPQAPVIRVKKQKKIIVVRVPNESPGASYRFILKKNGRKVAKKTSSRIRAKFRNLRGRIDVRYRILLPGGGKTKLSHSCLVDAS